MMILNDLGLLHVVNIVELCMNCHSLSLTISFISKVLIKSYMDYDDVMLTLSGLPPTFLYGRVDGVQDA
jgi:hypothetical protein